MSSGVPVWVEHPFRSLDYIGSQCMWCWGWVDDPRHINYPRGVRLYDRMPAHPESRRAARERRKTP